MNTFTISAALLVAVCALGGVTCLTNREFYELLNDDSEQDLAVDDSSVADDDVIELPGNEDDELDMHYLMTKLNLYEQAMDRLMDQETDLEGGSCKCRGNSCNCCYSKTFKVFRKKFGLNACFKVTFVKGNRFEVVLSANGRTLYRKTLGLRNGIKICRSVPKVRGKVCAQVYNVNIGRKSMCVRLTGEINLLIKKFKTSVKLGCFKFPGMEESDFEQGLLGEDLNAEALMFESEK